jgi:hypothetical protein
MGNEAGHGKKGRVSTSKLAPTNDACEKDYIRWKSKCFDVLVANLELAGDDAQKNSGRQRKVQKM